MHEFSIADAIVKNVLETVKKNKGKKVVSVLLEIGELTHVSAEQVSFWIKELFKDSVAEGAQVKVKTIKARIQCKGCGYKGGMGSDQEDSFRHVIPASCPRCNSFEIKIEKGRECILRRIQVLK
ncbi:MAG: hydrogenase maturation nickel metallochaperone HypA [Thermodesulfobacteriota bacterium]